ncbi:MAG TPA: phosphate/phosphite/phosphonate ABC transporter substrate-binding protein [Pilimelia sp.]|nr:phosphate/phosphite/phosphonate ABC transporter substrate-binding protein [Pilimelia sp.]
MRRDVRGRAAGAALAAVLLPAAAAGCVGGSAVVDGLPDTLRVGVLPGASADAQRDRYAPLGRHLADRLGVEVALVVAADYPDAVEALTAGRVDVAQLGALTYVRAAARSADVAPLVTEVDEETGTPRTVAAVVVPNSSPHRTVRDVVAAGGTFAFGDPQSTAGALYPRKLLTEAGARCAAAPGGCPPLAGVTYTGTHEATAEAVLDGAADAGGLALPALRRLERQGTVPAGALRVVGRAEVVGGPWVARAGLEASARTAVREAFTGIRDRELLSSLGARSYAPVSAADYAPVREQAARPGAVDGAAEGGGPAGSPPAPAAAPV